MSLLVSGGFIIIIIASDTWDDGRSIFQDQGLDVISEGLDTLKNMAHDMNEVSFLFWLFQNKKTLYWFYCVEQELDRQVPLMDEIDAKVVFLFFKCIFFLFIKKMRYLGFVWLTGKIGL